MFKTKDVYLSVKDIKGIQYAVDNIHNEFIDIRYENNSQIKIGVKDKDEYEYYTNLLVEKIEKEIN